MRPLKTVKGISDPYSRRILAHVVGKDALAVVARTPLRLRQLVSGLSRKQLRTRQEEGKWSIAEIVCHLCDTEVVMAFRYRMAIAQSGSPLQAMDENKWAAGLDYSKVDPRRKIALFIALREDHVRMLKSLPKHAWQRYGIHEERGKETVERIVQMYAGHDINHLRQIAAARKRIMEGRRT
jgi:hypothetical protein